MQNSVGRFSAIIVSLKNMAFRRPLVESKSLIDKSMINQNTPIQKHPDYWEISLESRVFARFIADITFIEIEVLENDFALGLRIESPFKFHDGEKTYVIDLRNPPSIGPALTILNRPLKCLHITKHGTLTVLFEEPLQLVVEPQDRFESWELHDKDGYGLLCGPGGGVF